MFLRKGDVPLQNLRRILIVGLCFSVILTACSPAKPTTILPPTSTPILSTPQPTLPSATPVPTSEPVGVGVPVIEYLNPQNKLAVISSVTGKVFDAFTPIPLGENFDYAFAPDGHTLALFSNARLYLIDLPSWNYRMIVMGVYGSPFYSPDGSLLALVSGYSNDSTLRILDIRTGEIKASTQAGFAIRNLKFSPDGKALMVYGPRLASSGYAANAGVSVGAPKVALFAIPDLRLLWSVALNGVRDGVFPKDPKTANSQAIYEPGAAWFFYPGVAFDAHREMLYLVHGDEDKLTTVDFTNRKVSTVDVHVKTSWLDQLLSLTAGVAYAKGMDGTFKDAVLSPDGKFLYVVGSTETVTQQAVTDSPLALLQVIATEDGTLVDQIETEAFSVTLSPDGRQVFLTGLKRINNAYGTPWTDVYDLSSQRIIKHLDNVSLIPTHRLDGKTVLASSGLISINMNYMVVIDPDSWVTVGEWKSTNDVGWLIDR